MNEFFMFGVLCLLSPISGLEECAYITEQPKKFYFENECYAQAVEKVNEMGMDLTAKGFHITHLQIYCVVDNMKQNT